NIVKQLSEYTPNGYMSTGNGPRKHGNSSFVGQNSGSGKILADDLSATLFTPEQQETRHADNKAVAEDTAVHAQGVVYLQAGETYIVKAQGDDSLRIVLGDRALNGQEINLRWGTDKTLVKDFEFTAVESGVYTFDMYMHNQSAAGMYDVSIVNKSRPEEPLKFFPTLESAQDAIINSSDDDGFRLGELVGTDGHG